MRNSKVKQSGRPASVRGSFEKAGKKKKKKKKGGGEIWSAGVASNKYSKKKLRANLWGASKADFKRARRKRKEGKKSSIDAN